MVLVVITSFLLSKTAVIYQISVVVDKNLLSKTVKLLNDIVHSDLKY